MGDLISRQTAIDAARKCRVVEVTSAYMLIDKAEMMTELMCLPSAQQEIVRCKDCKYWKQQTNYQGDLLSFGFCESDDMWRSLYGETTEVAHIDTDDDHYCGYAKRRTDEQNI